MVGRGAKVSRMDTKPSSSPIARYLQPSCRYSPEQSNLVSMHTGNPLVKPIKLDPSWSLHQTALNVQEPGTGHAEKDSVQSGPMLCTRMAGMSRVHLVVSDDQRGVFPVTGLDFHHTSLWSIAGECLEVRLAPESAMPCEGPPHIEVMLREAAPQSIRYGHLTFASAVTKDGPPCS